MSFRVGERSSYGVVDGTGVVDLGARMGPRFPDLTSYLQGLSIGDDRLRVPLGTADYEIDALVYEPVCRPQKIVCVAVNYEPHREETGRSKVIRPRLFSRFPDTLIGHGAAMILPRVSTQLDFEGELAVVIGRSAHRVSAARALDVVAGYACFNDGSVRDWQFHTSQFLPGKNFPASAPIGPALVTPDEVGPLDDLRLETRLNGEVMQTTRLGEMVFSVAELIAYVSAFTPLSPGDTIATGTPGGVGYTREPPIFMRSGDVVEVTIENVGRLENRVIDEPPVPPRA